MTTHEIINAREASEGEVFLTIRWDDTGHQTTERASVEVAKALGWQRPDPQPVDPGWMVEVARNVMRDERGMTAEEVVISSLRLALSRGHVVLAPVMPSEEEMLRDAREDAAQGWEAEGLAGQAVEARSGKCDHTVRVRTAHQARRNVYASLGAVGKEVSSGPVVPEVDWEKLVDQLVYAVNRHWTALMTASGSTSYAGRELQAARSNLLSTILENLKSGEDAR